MWRFLSYFALLIPLQIAVSLLFDFLPIDVDIELSLLPAGIIAALLVGARQIRYGLKKITLAVRRCGEPRPEAIAASILLLSLALALVTLRSQWGAASHTMVMASCEEVVLRALPLAILAGTKRWTDHWVNWAVLGSAVFFTLGHVTSPAPLILDKLIFGVAACLIFLATSNIWIAASMHAATNLLALSYYSLSPDPQAGVFALISTALTVCVLAFCVRTRAVSDRWLPLSDPSYRPHQRESVVS